MPRLWEPCWILLLPWLLLLRSKRGFVIKSHTLWLSYKRIQLIKHLTFENESLFDGKTVSKTDWNYDRLRQATVCDKVDILSKGCLNFVDWKYVWLELLLQRFVQLHLTRIHRPRIITFARDHACFICVIMQNHAWKHAWSTQTPRKFIVSGTVCPSHKHNIIWHIAYAVYT